MNESKGTYQLDLSDRLLLAQEGINVLDEHLEDLMHELVDDGEDMTNRETQNRFSLLYTSPSPRDKRQSRMPSSA